MIHLIQLEQLLATIIPVDSEAIHKNQHQKWDRPAPVATIVLELILTSSHI